MLRQPFGSSPCPASGPQHPAFARFDVGAFDRGPGNPVRGLFLPEFTCMRGVGMIEGFAIDVLGVIGQMSPDRCRQIGICSIWHN